MHRRAFLRRSGAALAGVGALARTERDADAQSGETYTNPVFERVFPDPTVVRAPDGTYFAYATYHDWGGAAWGGDRPLVPVIRSPNLVDWEYVGPAFDERPDWRDGDRGLWAPDTVHHHGEYLLYYSLSSWGDANPGIGVAAADSPAGPFADRGRLLQSEGVGVPNSIDPCFFAADDGPYLFWGSHRGIYGVRLAADGRSLAGDPFQVAGGGVEAPYVVERGGRYYLFGSRGTCCEGAASSYHVVVGRAESLRGPYRNRDGEDLLDAAGTTVLRGNDRFAAPGHNALATDDAGDDWLVYHAYERANPWVGETPRRVLFVDRVRWDEGWPTVGDGSPSASAPKPSVTDPDTPNLP